MGYLGGSKVTQKDEAKVVKRTPAEIHDELSGADATERTLRKFLDKALRKIRAVRFEPYIVDSDGKKKRNPLLKDVREYEATLRCVVRHKALRAEEAALLGSQPADASEYAEFAPEIK
jgi:hypothetical protein